MASKVRWLLSNVFFLLFLANIWNSCTKFATNNLICVKLTFICDQGTRIFPKSSVIAIIVCAYCKSDSIWIFCKESSLDGRKFFKQQSSLASAPLHMRERETDYILWIEYVRPKVGGGIFAPWMCIYIFS